MKLEYLSTYHDDNKNKYNKQGLVEHDGATSEAAIKLSGCVCYFSSHAVNRYATTVNTTLFTVC